MSGTVNNGRTAAVVFGPYVVRAGLVERLGVTTIAFFADAKVLSGVQAGTIDGEPYRVTSFAPSDPKAGGVKGMVRLTVEPIVDAGGEV